MKPKGSTMATFKLLFLIWKSAVVLRQLFCDNVNKGSGFIGVDWVFDADWVIFVINYFQLLSCGYKVFIFIIVGWPTRSGYPRFKIYTSKKVSYEVLLKFFHIQISDHLTLKPTQPGAIACIHHLRTLNYKLLFNSSGCLFPLPP